MFNMSISILVWSSDPNSIFRNGKLDDGFPDEGKNDGSKDVKQYFVKDDYAKNSM